MENTTLYEKIGSQIREKRKNKKISCEEMGKFLGVGKSTYSYYERGKVRITVDDLIKICKRLELDWVSLVDNASK